LTTAILFITLVIFLLLNVPIAASLGMSCAMAMLFGDGSFVLETVPQRMFTAIDSFPYMAIPFFLLAGNLMGEGGISRRLVNLCRSIVGRLPGGLGIVTVLASAFFGAISGSNAATVAAIGGIMVPEMEKDGYPKDYSCAVSAAAGTLGVVVPPSVPMVTYGVISGVSIGTMFIAGFVPAALLVLAYSAVIIFQSSKMNIRPTHATLADILKAFKESILAILMPVIILGGIYGGFFTPTESAAVACLYAIIVTMFIYREIDLKGLIKAAYDAGKTMGTIFFIIACANAFVWLLTYLRLPAAIAQGVLSISDNKYVILFLLNVVMLVLGVFLETNCIILLVTPIMLTICASIGVSPLVLGIVMIVNTSIGMITPPMAMNIVVASGIGRLSIEAISKKIIPFLLVAILVILMITYFPVFITFLPSVLGKI